MIQDTLSSVALKFQAYTSLVESIANASIRCLLVGGGPGLGKSWLCTNTLQQCAKRLPLHIIRSAGHITPLALYRGLFNSRTVQDIVVLDDCDDAFKNKDCLSLLKAATDTRNPRTITWATSAKHGLPQQFDFAGRIVIITNRPVFSDPLLQPLIDRAHCFELVLNQAERLERILSLLRQIAKSDSIYYEVSDWITRHADELHALDRLTVRSAVKACELSRISRGDWRAYASITLLAESA